MENYKELIKRREELRKELIDINNEVHLLAKTVYKGKLEKAVALLKEVNEAGIFDDEEETTDFDNIIFTLKCYINIIKERN